MHYRCDSVLRVLVAWAIMGAHSFTTAQVAVPEQTIAQAKDSQVGDAKAAGDNSDSAVKPAEAQPPIEPLQFVAPKTFEMQIGVRVTAPDGNMLGTMASTVFPTPWPEQTVEVVESNLPTGFQSSFRDLPGGNQQLLFFSPLISANTVAEATIKVRITKSHIIGPEETTHFKIGKRLPRDISAFLSSSPYIETNSSELKKIVREIEDSEPLTDWKKVELLYDWVRDNITYQRGELKTVRDALRDRTGDCEEMTSTFVALCRVARVPARVVWIPNHCYPEFYLEDQQGKGHWFPCQVAGTRNFGSMPEYLPILQKGDRFKVPEHTEVQRYLADHLTSKKVLSRNDPQVEFIRQLLGDGANLKAPDLEAGKAAPAN